MYGNRRPNLFTRVVALFMVATQLLPLNVPWITSGWASSSQRIITLDPLVKARQGHTATVLSDGRVLIAGGMDSIGVLASAEIFDPNTRAFRAVASPMRAARVGHTATRLADGRVLIAGGQNANGALATAEIFD